jgi:hypothetical protein
VVVDELDVGIVSLHLALAFAGVGLGPSVCCCLECCDEVRSRRGWHEGATALLHLRRRLSLYNLKDSVILFVVGDPGIRGVGTSD